MSRAGNRDITSVKWTMGMRFGTTLVFLALSKCGECTAYQCTKLKYGYWNTASMYAMSEAVCGF